MIILNFCDKDSIIVDNFWKDINKVTGRGGSITMSLKRFGFIVLMQTAQRKLKVF